MDKIFQMLSGFFSKSEYDLSGDYFKIEFKKSENNVLLDVRTPAEHNNASLPSALHIDFLDPSFSSSVGKLRKDKNYFVFCRSGSRSASAVSIMRKMGFEAFNLVGGIGAWPA